MNLSLINILVTESTGVMESLILIYYTSSVMDYKSSRLKSNIIIILGCLIQSTMCFLGNPTLNILSNIIIVFLVLYLGFSENVVSIILKTVILIGLLMFGELLPALFFKWDINESIYSSGISAMENIIFTFSSKLIYFISVIMMKRVTVRRNTEYLPHNMIYFLVLPISTIFLLGCLGRMCSELTTRHAMLLSLAALAIILSNFVVYIVYDKMIDNFVKINKLQKISYKEQLDYSGYKLIKEKYDDLKIMVHDFDKYYKNIEGMLSDNQSEALSLINQLKNKNKEFLLVEYTNNKALNILLSQKMKQCNTENIDFQIYIQDVDLSFIDEMDIVAMFANLIDNAIESCRQSQNKKIFLSIYTMNDAYIVVRVDNGCDHEPIINNGLLRTRKQNQEQHGIGMVSIKKTLNNYNGRLKWEYNKDTGIFSTTAIINYYTLTKKTLTNSAP